MVQHPEDGPARMAEVAAAMGATFPYLYDETQDVAKAYRAACTPDFFLFDADRRLVYRGQLDGARPGNDVPVTGHDLRAALDAVLAGAPAPEPQLPSLGCNIKWKPGNEPDYFAGSLGAPGDRTGRRPDGRGAAATVSGGGRPADGCRPRRRRRSPGGRRRTGGSRPP